jgi:hypothetical protein
VLGRLKKGVLRLRTGLISLSVLCFSGCGSDFAGVSGAVRMDGQPLVGGTDVRGTVYYYPESSTGAPAVGRLDEAGHYSLTTGSNDGVRPGPYIVTIRATRIIPSAIEGDAPSGRPITPMFYADPQRSPFRVEVQSGSNILDFDIQSKP